MMAAMLDWIFVYGPPGSGKSTLARRLSSALHLPVYDIDTLIETQSGQSIPEIFTALGERGFRQREKAALIDTLRLPPGVVALGGGALLDGENRARVEALGRVICLAVPFEVLLARLQGGSSQRPLLSGDMVSRLQSLLEQRSAHYASFPLQLDTSQSNVDEIAWQSQVALGVFHITGMGAGYDVRVQENGLDQLGEMLARRALQGPVVVVTDTHVAGHHLARVVDSLAQAGYQARSVTIPAGEEHKTVDTLQRLWRSFLEHGLERSSTVVALGGGVVGDLAGFAAATYLRGVRWVGAPTSLLAMVDASLGGKTGADLPQGKNLVGTFHSPSLVLADPVVLQTLPEVELRNGMAELVKNAIIADPLLFDRCRQGLQPLAENWPEIVRRAMSVKIQIIQEDPFERNRRACLNLGHTLGHALELTSDFQLRHGEAVAIGMVAAARLAEKMNIAGAGLAGDIAGVLTAVGLPTEIPASLDRQRILAAMQVDKKKAGGKVRFVLPVEIGKVRWGVEIDRLSAILEG